MKYTLKDYQDEAVRDVLINLKRAEDDYGKGHRSGFALSAVTGAGKTVMAAAVFEAIFYGDDTFEFDADPGAVILWFSDDPSLNEQTRFRLAEASDKLRSTQLVVVQENFQQSKFDSGKIYFLNTQKLSKNSLLVRGHDYDGEGQLFPRPDTRQNTIWDTIKNTIEDKRMTLYLVLDEAHRGMGKNQRSAERNTIVQRLISGHAGIPAIPIVWGISATIQRFRDAMEEAKTRTKRTMLPNVEVDPAKVQESGLLKSTIVVDTPNEEGVFETVLLRRATEKLRESDKAWKAYAKEQGMEEPVAPLMVFQIPDKPNQDDVGEWIDRIRETWPELSYDSFAHVLGEHTDQYFGSHTVPYIAPQLVQGRPHIRVLIAKSAISTGWDCPRAEVMVSFRTASDETHITQLMGRMVRTPLARSIPGNDRLNSVECLLPHFDQGKVERITQMLMKGGDADGPEIPGRRVLFNPVEMTPNKDVPADVWEKFVELPTERLPKVVSHPVKRLTWFASELSRDHLIEGAYHKTMAELITVFDSAKVRFAKQIEKRRKELLDVLGVTITRRVGDGSLTYDDFVERADMQVVNDVMRKTRRILHAEVVKHYVNYLVDREIEPDLTAAHETVAAFGLVEEIADFVFSQSNEIFKKMHDRARIGIAGLPDDRQERYREIISWTIEPEANSIAKPVSRYEKTNERAADGTETILPTYSSHILSDDAGNFPFVGNDWEVNVLEAEMRRDGFVAWYRNPAGSAQESLGIAYEIGDGYKVTRPDFIFFARVGGKIVADIVDPHGSYFADALPRLKGMARFAEERGGHFRRIEVLSQIKKELRVLDLKNDSVRKAVHAATSADVLFAGPISNTYA